mgnify:FL=1
MHSWSRLPRRGDIVKVWWRVPAPADTKHRPAVVIDVRRVGNDFAVLLCYATTQKTDRLFAGDFKIVRDTIGDDGSGLTEPVVKFVTSDRRALLVSDEAFTWPNGKSRCPIVGRVPARFFRQFETAVAASDATRQDVS